MAVVKRTYSEYKILTTYISKYLFLTTQIFFNFHNFFVSSKVYIYYILLVVAKSRYTCKCNSQKSQFSENYFVILGW